MTKLKELVSGRLMDLAGLGYVVKLNIKDGEHIVVDGTGAVPFITEDNIEPNATITMSEDTFEKLMYGTLNPALAYSLGKLKVEGSLGVALKLSSMLDE